MRSDAAASSDERALCAPWQRHTLRWLAQAAPAIALAAHNAACLLDLECAVLDGSFSRPLQTALLNRVNDALDQNSRAGVARPQLLPDTSGPDARAIGGALLPLYVHCAPDRESFLKLVAVKRNQLKPRAWQLQAHQNLRWQAPKAMVRTSD